MGKTEVYSRVCGFFRPVQQWNKGKKEEFKERREKQNRDRPHTGTAPLVIMK
jgi:hypothetical protein